MLACGTHFFFDNVVSIEPKDDMCRLQRPKVLSELAMCVNVPKIALMIHPGSTLTPPRFSLVQLASLMRPLRVHLNCGFKYCACIRPCFVGAICWSVQLELSVDLVLCML